MLTLGIIGAAHFTAKQAYPPQEIIYPYALTVENPGFESGVITPWVAISGGTPLIITDPVATGT